MTDDVLFSVQNLTEPVDDDSLVPVFTNVDMFIREYLVHVVERRVATGSGSGIFWCEQWWAHAEAVSRLYAFWRTWEMLRVTDPATGMSVWWRDHLDPHLAVLTSEYGPFARCRPGEHRAITPLPVQPAPADVLAQLPEGAS